VSFLQQLKNRDAEGVKHKPVNNSGMPGNGTRRTNLSIGDTFETTYVQEPVYEGGKEEIVEDEKREITDREHSEKALEKILVNHFTFKDYLTILYQRYIKND